jgi:hypothetical protein
MDGTKLMLLSENRSTIAVPLSTISSLELAWGKRGHWRTGALIGVGIGALSVVNLCSGSSHCIQSSGDVGAALLVVGVGAGIGALVGSLVKSDRWIAVPTGPAGTPVGQGSERGHGVGIGVRLSF